MADAGDLADRLAGYASAVEVGVGNRPDLAVDLAERGLDVLATDLTPRPVPEGVAFARDDVLSPDTAVYAGADLVYARHLPPELHRATRQVAREAGADCCFTTLGGDPPTIPVEAEPVCDRTLYWAIRDGRGMRG